GKINNNSSYSLTGTIFDSKWSHSGQIPVRAIASGLISHFGSIDPTEGGVTSRNNLYLNLSTNLNNCSFLKNQFYYSKYDFELYSNFTFFLDDSINGDQIRQRENRHLFGYNGAYSKDYYFGDKKVLFLSGLQYRHDFSFNNELSKSTNKVETKQQIQLGDINETNVAAYFSNDLRLNDKWNLDLGLRYEVFFNKYIDKLNKNRIEKSIKGKLFPKINAQYNVNSNLRFNAKIGKGFHSNDTRVAAPKQGKNVLPSSYGADLGMTFKDNKRLVFTSALWYLWLDQEFVYVGDAGVIELGGRTQRLGMEMSIRYQFSKQWWIDMDANISNPRQIDADKGYQYIPLAPISTSIGGLTYKDDKGNFSASLRYRHMADRPANESNNVIAKGYMIWDAQMSYLYRKFTLGFQINNILNSKWKETQFNTESRLKDEQSPIEEIHYTAGNPFFLKLSLSYQL
ncbi:MAG: hypothetical protein RLZZ546_1725, partial [Bacteroidota bacterium]